MKLYAHFNTSVGDFGHQADSLLLKGCHGISDHRDSSAVQAEIINACGDLSGMHPVTAASSIRIREDAIEIFFSPFRLTGKERVAVTIHGEKTEYSPGTCDLCTVRGESDFDSFRENGIVYRMHVPSASVPRPLILFLHGGGECGSDNCLQLTGTMGAISLAERFPDFYIMAPQAPDNGISIEAALGSMKGFSQFDHMDLGALPHCGKSARGWNRDYLAGIEAEILRLVRAEKVDPSRIYLTGMSMGGGGCLRMLSVAPGLFAASCIICPTMNSETYSILHELPPVPCWISSAYIDHQRNRHAFLTDACSHLWEQGRRDVKLTLFTAEELKKYGIGCSEGLTDAQIRSENHNCWTLVYHNERHMLSWMPAQVNSRRF